MTEILLTSSALILTLMVLRRLFRNSVPRRVQYALWGLVLLRLLVPVSLPAAGFSLLTAAESLTGSIEALYAGPVSQSSRGQDGQPVYGPPDAPFLAVGPATDNNTYSYSGQDGLGAPVESQAEYRQQFSLSGLLRPVWYAGMALMACRMLAGNLAFWQGLRKKRRYFPAEGCKRPVYLVEEGLPSPCLFGLFRPAIYLTPAAVRTPESLRHVLAHEETHARHLDPLWSLLRSVCLVVYWFDPLVWWAALASRADCELACDEGALRRLGEEQRIPYGQTLLSLIPVAKAPEDPLLSATTMTAGKRQLKDRIIRIAENRRTAGTALFAAAALAALACAVTFTGAKTAVVPMTEAEVQWFNQQFFNGDAFNIRNQFLSSTYELPEDIDLFALFYCGSGQPAEVTEAERQAAAQPWGGSAPGVDLTKCSTEEMDTILEENAGLTLGETSGLHLDEFTYLPDYDAYYHFHGDTNYRASVTIASGEREGDLARLHYVDDFYAEGWKCVTLRKTAEGNWQFVSNLPWDAPMEYPAARLTIPLDGLESCTPQPAEPLPFPNGTLTMLNTMDNSLAETLPTPYLLMFFQDDAGFCYAGVQHAARSSWPQPFLKMRDGSVTSETFQDILGYDGFSISYTSAEGEPLTDYYCLTEDGVPMLLARCGQDVLELDLNIDGHKELVSCPGGDARLAFQRDGNIYNADIRALLEEHWPAASDIRFDGWSSNSRCLYLSAQTAYPDAGSHLEGVTATVSRTLFFDGESLLLCAGLSSPENQLPRGYYAPDTVLNAAKQLARETMEQKLMEDGPGFDDWRIGTLLGPFYETISGHTYEIWQTDFELHTTTPDLVMLAGSAYLENGWLGSGRPSYLIFRSFLDEEQEYLYAVAESDTAPGSAFFRANMIDQLITIGELTYDELDGQDLYDSFRNRPDQLMESLGTLLSADQRDAALERLAARLSGDGNAWNAARDFMRTARLTRGGPEAWERLQELVSAAPSAAGDAQAALTEIMAGDTVVMTMTTSNGGGGSRYYEIAPGEGNGPNREKCFTASFDWAYAEQEAVAYTPILQVSSQNGALSFLFWEGSDLVCLRRQDQTEAWFWAVPHDGEVPEGNIYDFMRYWYDEAEMEHLRGEGLIVPDRGQSRREIAETWVNAYTQASLLVTPGSKYECSYNRAIVQVSEDGELPDSVFPSWTEGRERFHFSFEEVFVLGNDRPATLSWNWAGNTGPYEGGGAPEGALSRRLTGFLYKTEEGWRCDAVGTGP